MPLAGYCALGCMDNGTMSPSGSNPPKQFGFMSGYSWEIEGTFRLIILIPDAAPLPASIAISGSLYLIATRIGGVWTSGNLDAFLGISVGSYPINPINAFLPNAQVFWSSAAGFAVFQAYVTAPFVQLMGQPNMEPLLDLLSPLPLGSYIVAFLNEYGMSPTWEGTTNSGSIFVGVEPPAPPAVPQAMVMVVA